MSVLFPFYITEVIEALVYYSYYINVGILLKDAEDFKVLVPDKLLFLSLFPIVTHTTPFDVLVPLQCL